LDSKKVYSDDENRNPEDNQRGRHRKSLTTADGLARVSRSDMKRKSSSVGCVSYVDRDALKLFELVKKRDLEGLVVKRKDSKYTQRTLWYKVLNPTYTEKTGRQEFFQRQ
jgi:hypothetical protein